MLNLSLFSRKKIPQILQAEMAECGLACLAMVASFHGHRLDLASMRARFAISGKGVNLAQIMRMADQLHLSGRALKLDLDHLAQLQTPAILHWDMNHFVVLAKVGRREVVIHDPAMGVRRLSLAEVSQHFTGVALELTPAPQFTPQTELRRLSLADCARGMAGLKGSLGQILAVSLALQVLLIAAPFYQQLIVDEVLATFDADLLVVLATGFGLLALISSGGQFVRDWLVLRLGNIFSFSLSIRLARHLFRLPLAWFEKRHIGDVMSRMQSLHEIQKQLCSGLVGAVVDGLMALITAAMMLIYAPGLAALVVASVLIYGLIRYVSFGAGRRLAEEQIVAGAKESSHFMETIRAMPSVRVFGHELQRLNGWQDRLAQHYNTGLALGKFQLTFNGANQVLFGVQNVLVLYCGARLAMENALSVGMLFAFLSYKQQFTDRAANLINQWIGLKMLDLHLDRIADIALNPLEEEAAEQLRPAPASPTVGGLKVSDLGFRYSEAEPWIFRHLNFTIHAGESVALIGPSGCGKTTLIKILMGLNSASEGEVWADGEDIRRMGLSHWRGQIAAVLQEDQLLSGSLLDNICFFSPQPEIERIIQCAELAGIHADIMQMPMQYQTLVGDMGANLSGGQKQRLLLARALYRQPRYLFLDEATSHLDVELEERVNAAVRALNITRIIIAHRPQTIASADRVIDLRALQLSERREAVAA